MYRIREKIRGVASRIRRFGWRSEGVADQLMELEDWLHDKNLDVWNLKEVRKEGARFLIRQEKEIAEYRKEIDKLAAMYWKATGKWPKGHPKTGSYGIRYSYWKDRKKYLPEGATMQVVSSNPPLQPPPSNPTCEVVPFNRYGEQIDLSEVEEVMNEK